MILGSGSIREAIRKSNQNHGLDSIVIEISDALLLAGDLDLRVIARLSRFLNERTNATGWGSIPFNIAEAYERGGEDFARFLRIAQGSGSPTMDLRVYPWFCQRRYLALKGRRRIAILRSVTVMATPASRSIDAAS